MLFFPLYCDIISLISLKIIQPFHLLLDFAENQGVFLYFKIQNSVWITEGSDNGDLDNQGSTVHNSVVLVRVLNLVLVLVDLSKLFSFSCRHSKVYKNFLILVLVISAKFLGFS